MKTIALCMIVKNEQEYLRRCLDSVVGKVDQIVIVDTGSTDGTVSIAKEFTNEVYHFEWINDFSAARNESLKYAKTDYILVLDADEYLEESVNILKSIETDADYYFTKIHNIMTQGRAINHLAIRFFANNKGLLYRNRLHEHLNTYEDEYKYKAAHAKFTIMHTGYTDEMLEGREKSKRNLSLMLKEVKENPSVYNLFNMGRTYNWIGEHEKAIEFLKKAYPLSKELSILPELIATLCRSLGEMRRYNEALHILQEAEKVFPREVDLIHLQALFYKELGYHRDAIAKMELCLEIGDQGITFTEGNGTYVAQLKLAEWHSAQFELTKSYEHIVKAANHKNDFLPIMIKYFEIVEKVGLSLEETFQDANRVFNVQSISQLEKLLEVLYQLRHPLLNKYLITYNINVQNQVVAVAQLYEKNYQSARDQWNKISNLEGQNGIDIFLLSTILNDEKLFLKSIPLLNVSIKEKKFLKQFVENSVTDRRPLTGHVESILEKVAVNLMRLHEFELFEKVLDVIWQGSTETKINICEYLAAYGFGEIAIDLLLKLFQSNPKNIKVIGLLGDVCLCLKYFEDAKLFYSKLLEMEDSYASYEKTYNLFNNCNDEEGKEYMSKVIVNKFELSLWAR